MGGTGDVLNLSGSALRHAFGQRHRPPLDPSPLQAGEGDAVPPEDLRLHTHPALRATLPGQGGIAYPISPRSPTTATGSSPGYSSGSPARFTQTGRNPNAAAPAMSQRLEDTKITASGSTAKASVTSR